MYKVIEVEVRCRRNGVRKQITAKEGPLELKRGARRERETESAIGKEAGGERLRCTPQRELRWVLHPDSFHLRSQGRISIEYLSALPMCLLRVVVFTDWSAPGQGGHSSLQLVLRSAMVSLPLVLLLFWA